MLCDERNVQAGGEQVLRFARGLIAEARERIASLLECVA
jgi:hypothetical protein